MKAYHALCFHIVQAFIWLAKIHFLSLQPKIHADGNSAYPEREPWQPMNFIR